MTTLITPPLVAHLRRQFPLDWAGTHGAGHWARVRQNGLRLAECSPSGASTRVIELFAFLHDFRRRNDHGDRGHGARAADSMDELRDLLPELSGEEAEMLKYACRHHSDGMLDAELTVQVCWDADRLDLGRVGCRNRADRLCTPAARTSEILGWAQERSERSWSFRFHRR